MLSFNVPDIFLRLNACKRVFCFISSLIFYAYLLYLRYVIELLISNAGILFLLVEIDCMQEQSHKNDISSFI